MNVSVELKDGLAVVKVKGLVDLESSPALRSRIIGLCGGDVKGVLMDMSEVKYLDSSGMATLVELLNRLAAAGRKMVITGLKNEMRQMFSITKLDDRFRFCADAAEAAALLGKEQPRGA
ncbi:MAG: STAS domain-containing protein [Planctomycetes bacterium]|nr:STAS domain-containing protein [Planctomycetota bacterium]